MAMDLLSDLTAPQREAVTHRDGPLLVLAGAGSGKTRVITRRVAHLLRHGIPGRQILALTFTNKAAGEMKERIEALAPRSGVWIGTFHGFCARLLRQYAPKVGLDRGFTIYDQSDRLRTIKRVMEEQGLDAVGATPEQVESLISCAKNDMVGPEEFARRHQGDHVATVAARVYPAYQEKLKASSAVDFDDLLAHVVALLRHDRAVRAELDAQYRYILVDEYQDTNLAQYAIVRALSLDHPNLCVTGDPDQSIYGWRGANLGNILEFEHDFEGCKVVKLEQNYRSTKNILRVADHLIRFNRRRKPKSLTTENPDGDPVELTIYPTESDEARGVAGAIADLVRRGDFTFRDVAIFVRTAAQTRPIEAALRAAKIPYQVVGGMSFYERQEIKDLLAYLHLLLNPKDDVAFERVVNMPPRGVGATTLDRLRAHARQKGLSLLAMAREAGSLSGFNDRAARALRDFVLTIDELAALRDHPAEEVVRRTLVATGLHAHFTDGRRDGDEDRAANLDELVSAARQFDDEHPGASVREFVEDVSLASAVDRWEDDAGAVALMTLHAAKGLEFPVVFIVGLEQGLLPHARSSDSDSELEEERRLFFVGITRARRLLFLSQCRVREFRGQRTVTIPSSFLAELPEEPLRIVEHADPSQPWPTRRRLPAQPPRPIPPGGGFRLITAAELQGDAAPEPAPGDLARYRPGVTVVHPTYGLGRIVAIDGAGPNRKGRIAFAAGGERTFVLAKTPLRLVGGGGAAPR